MVVNASDIKICLPFDGEEEEYVPIAHIFNASLNLSASLMSVIHYDDDDSIWENDIVDRLSYIISGTSYLVIAADYSFDDLLDMKLNRVSVPVLFNIGTNSYSGNVIIRNLRITGNTEQNALLSFIMKGQGVFTCLQVLKD